MFHRCILLFVIVSLALSGGAAWAASVFVNINAHNSLTNRDLQAFPAGVSAGGVVVLQGLQTTGNPPYCMDACYYSGGSNGTSDEHHGCVQQRHEGDVELHE